VTSHTAPNSRKGHKKTSSAAGQTEAILRLCCRRYVDKALLGELLALVRASVPYDAATLYLITSADRGFEELYSVGKQVEPLEFLPLGSGAGLSGWAAYSGKGVLLKDRSRGQHFNPGTDMACFLSLPIPTGEHPLGVLNLGCHKAGGLDEDHLGIAEALSVQLAVVLDKIVCQRVLENSISSLENARTRLDQSEQKLSAGSGGQAIAGVMITLIHEINDQLSIVVGNVERLLVEPAIGNQSVMTRLRRVEEAAIKLRACSRKLHRLSQPKKQLVESAE
jgi:hypothetical protein